jgi:hypothetical protein
MKLLRQCYELLYFKLENESMSYGQTGSAEHCSGNKTGSAKVATTPTENGHRQDALADISV